MAIPHLAVPFALDGRGHARTVEQDTVTEVGQCVAVLLATRPGDRLVVPGYGIDDRTFDTADGIDDESIADAVAEWEPRVTVDITRAAIDRSGRLDITVEVDRQ